MSNELKASSSVYEHRETNIQRLTPLRFLHRVTAFLTRYGVETHGIVPIPVAERVDTRWYQMFFMWFSVNMNILIFGVGTVGPAFFSLGVRDAIATILVVDSVFCLFPAFFAVFGPKLGMRAMVQSRYSWGYYGSIIPSVLNALTQQGYLILNCIIGGQTLASMNSHLSDALGIVIISVISLSVASFGYHFLHWYESIVWIPNVVAFIAMLAIGYPQLHANQFVSASTPHPSSIISFASTIAASIISWSTMTPDYGVYHNPSASSARIFLYVYLGLLVPNITCHSLGVAFAAAAPSVPAWTNAFQNSTSVGGLVYGVLAPLGIFGKFLTVLVALMIPSMCVPIMYTFSTSLMSVTNWFTLVPRWVYIVVSEVILIPVAIVGAHKFYTTFVDMLAVIGYWSAAFTGIVVAEHVLFRGASFTEMAYPTEIWNIPESLPRSGPAILAFLCACGAVVPFMSQAWYVGPVARGGSGDCGIYVGLMVAVVVYVALRVLERWWDRGRQRRVKMQVGMPA